MNIEYDNNGSKSPIPVIVQTITNRIHGNIHVTRDQRLKDELDLLKKFIAITDAVVYSSDDRVLYEARFLAVQRSQIVWVIPDSEITA